MAFNTYNNNQDRPNSNVYTPIIFSNPDSNLQQTRFSITYFNKVMQISIAPKDATPSAANGYPTFNNTAAIKVYISYYQAKMLSEELKLMFHSDKTDMNNVCLETKNGLLKISNGKEYNSPSPVIAILYMATGGTVISEALYQCKQTYEIPYNYKDGSYSTHKYPSLEIDTFIMTLEEYYKAASYAIASSVSESSMYHNKAVYDIIRSIAGKVGANTSTSYSKAPNQGSYNNHSFLNSNNTNGINEFDSNVPKEYQQSSFDDIVNGIVDMPVESDD